METILQSLSLLLNNEKLNLDQLTELRLSANEFIYIHQHEPLKSIAMRLREDIEIKIADLKYHEESAAEIARQHQQDGC